MATPKKDVSLKLQGKVLVVEDGLTQAERLRILLADAGHQVTIAALGERALELAPVLKPDLVLLDINLPDLDGRDVAKRLKADPLTASIPTIFMTGVFRDVADVVTGLNAGADDYLLKPVQEGELLARVNAALRAKRAAMESLRLARQLLLVGRVGRQLAAILQIESLLSSVTEALRMQFEYPFVHLFLLEGQQLTPAGGTLGAPFPRDNEELLVSASVAQGATLRLGQPRAGNARPCSPEATAAVAIPIRFGHNILGVLAVESDRADAFEPSDLLALETLTDLVGVALNNSNIHRKLEYLANHDELTGLYNRRAILESIDVELKRCVRYQRAVSVLYLDLDHFKSINDRYGHIEGDRLLRAVAHAIKSTLRTVDHSGRLGGDEFLLVLPESDSKAAEGLAARLLRALSEISLIAENGERVTAAVSVGFASYPEVGVTDPVQLLHLADQALYRAKTQGRNRFEGAPRLS